MKITMKFNDAVKGLTSALESSVAMFGTIERDT